MKIDQGVFAFPHRVTEKLRFNDTDRQGHINNAVFATLCEASRVAFLYEPDPPLYPPGHKFVIAKLSLSFLAEMNWPGEVTIGAGITRIGNSSFAVEQGLYKDEQCCATAESVIVLMNEETRASAPLPGDTRARLEALMVERPE